eukprot:7380487-Alexandrium_andersonii.AAC.1
MRAVSSIRKWQVKRGRGRALDGKMLLDFVFLRSLKGQQGREVIVPDIPDGLRLRCIHERLEGARLLQNDQTAVVGTRQAMKDDRRPVSCRWQLLQDHLARNRAQSDEGLYNTLALVRGRLRRAPPDNTCN